MLYKYFNFIGSIKHKILFGSLFVVVLPLILVIFYNYSNSVNSIESNTLKQMSVVGETISAQLDNYFKEIEVISANIIQNNHVRLAMSRPFTGSGEIDLKTIRNENEINTYLGEVCHQKDSIDSVIIYGFNNANFFFHSTNLWNMNYDATTEEWYKATIAANNKWIISEKRYEQQLYTSVLSQKEQEVITFARLIQSMPTFKPIGVLAINIKVEALQQMSERANYIDFITVTNENGNLILGNIPENPSDYISTISHPTVAGWKIEYFTSRSEMLTEIRKTRDIAFLIFGISILFASVIAGIISSGISYPIKLLNGRMKNLGNGIFEDNIDLNMKDEIGELINGFNNMSQKIKELIAELQLKENQRLKTELYAVQARINPHFIYNTLNGIRWLAFMDEKNKTISSIECLLSLMKIYSKYDEFIRIEDEIYFLRAYTNLMKMRYDNFTINIEAADDVRQFLTIPFILQPLVENAIFHGIASIKNRKGEIQVYICRDDNRITAVVMDNGNGMTQEAINKVFMEDKIAEENMLKIGIKNVFDRLKLRFDTEASVQIISNIDVGTKVELYWPAITAGGNTI